MTIENARWYALYTKPKWEKKVAELLARRNVETYCPLNRKIKYWSDRKKIVEEPLFQSYIFVRIPETVIQRLRETEGVVNVVYWLGKPAVVRDHEIEVIKRFLQEYNDVRLEKTQVGINDRIVVTNGPLIHQEGNVIEVRQKTIRVNLSSLGYAMIAEVEKVHVERVNFVVQNQKDYGLVSESKNR